MNNYTLYTVGDCCITMQVGSNINEEWSEKVIAMQRWFQSHPIIGLKDVIIAYNSISLQYNPLLVKQHYRPPGTISAFIKEMLVQAYEQATIVPGEQAVIRIPVCYDREYGPDLEWIARSKQLDLEEVVRLHTGSVYRVYMIGFLPGFPYMAAVPEAIAAPRKKGPAPVAAGSIGIAGIQTGIYPLASPGGWQIIGRTPLQLFHPLPEDRPLLQAGDHVQFYKIVKEEFISWKQ
ncbi:MAG: 5-oxoprolinase subunit PxpB [Williamsia sp.]|nr:5-oxoprolinase subunit PxpB [Williamsia sp.]